MPSTYFPYNMASTYDVCMINKATRTGWWYRVNKVADRGPSSTRGVYLSPYSLLLSLYPLLDEFHPFPDQLLLQLRSTCGPHGLNDFPLPRWGPPHFGSSADVLAE